MTPRLKAECSNRSELTKHRNLVPSRGIEPRQPVLQTGMQPLHLQGMEESYGVEPYRAYRRVIVFETITDRSVLLSKMADLESNRTLSPHLRGVIVFKTIADHSAL